MKLLMAVVACLLAPAVAGAARPPELVLAELRASTDGVKAGQAFDVGVRLKIKPGWHVYWKYPGDSGMPTRVEIALPEGWKVGPVHFPVPKKFVQAGDVIGYGYEEEVMLIARITPPEKIESSSVELKANVRWLACADVCIAGKASLSVTLPVKDDPKPAFDEIFQQWREWMPVRTGGGLVTTTLSRGTTPRFVALAKFDAAYEAFVWFLNPPEKSGVKGPEVQIKGVETKLSFELLPQPKGGEPMEFVVAYTDSQGKRRGVEFTLDLPPAPKQ